MNFQFDQASHSYGVPGDLRNWTSATAMVAIFHDKFDAVAMSESTSRNMRSKWFGMDPFEIRARWDAKSRQSRDLGHWYHSKKEAEILNRGYVTFRDQRLKVYPPLIIDGKPSARPQQLEPGVYVEHMMYDEEYLVCGMEDVVIVTDDFIDMVDHKTSLTIDSESFKDKRMYPPLSEIRDCNFGHYTVQMNLYMYMALQHNPTKQAGNMVINHVMFYESEGPYGERIMTLSADGHPIVKQLKRYEIPNIQPLINRMLNTRRHQLEAFPY